MLNKYSKKLVNFIDNNNNNTNNYGIHIDINNNIITQIVNAINTSANDDIINVPYTVKQTIEINKLHEMNVPPLLYLYVSQLKQHKLINAEYELGSFDSFVLWYKNNQHLIDLHKLGSNIKNKKINEELNELYELLFNPPISRKKLHETLYENPFCPLDIQQYVESMDQKLLIIDNDIVEMYIYINKNDHLDNVIDMKKVFHIIRFMNQIANHTNNNGNNKQTGKYLKPLITLILTSQRKIINGFENGVLTPMNINSGSSIGGTSVNIWRREEVYKVLIHELIHFHRIDFHQYDYGYNALHNYIMDKYKIEGKDCPNESYTEFFATIINAAFCSYYMNVSLNDILKREIKFTLFQVKKILLFYGIDSVEKLGVIPIKQNTSVFSYFVIKGSLLFNMDKVFGFIDNDIKNMKITNRIKDFKILITECMTNEYLNFVDSIEFNKNDNRFIATTMRMTATEIV